MLDPMNQQLALAGVGCEFTVDLNRSEPQGIIRITCPVGILHARIGAMLGDFLVATPRVTVHLEATNRVVDVIGEGIDVAIRVRPPPLKDCELVMKVLGERSWCFVASPELLRPHGMPEVLADLASMPSLDFGPAHGEHVW
jgi:DNA-binding transcriptional LysR family regulator